MIRRTLTAAAAIAGLAVAAPVSASAAEPGPGKWSPKASSSRDAVSAGTCNLSAPTRVAIGKPSLTLYGKISGTCAANPNPQSGWTLVHPSRGPVTEVVFDKEWPTGDGRWVIPDTAPIGSQTFEPIISLNPDETENTQNRLGVTVKLAAGAWISSSRTADVVTLKGTSLLYSVSSNSYFKRSAAGVFQFREKGSTTWQTLKGGLWTNSKGEVTLSYRYSKVRDYRFSLYSTSISWDLGSAVTTR